MRAAAVCIIFVLTCTSESFVASIRYIDPMSPQLGSDIGNKRMDLTEPSCDLLRALWRNTKRQNRAAKANVGYPMYPEPYIWQTRIAYPDRPKAPTGYRGAYGGRARSRAAGGAPIYGRLVHKAPPGSRLRNGMRTRNLEDLKYLYGTVTRHSSLNGSRPRNRIGGISQVPQAGSFEALKNLIQTERARELQEQHIAEEMEAGDLKEITNEEGKPHIQQFRKHFPNPLPPLQIPPQVNYDYNQRREMPNIPNVGQAWSRSGPLPRKYMWN